MTYSVEENTNLDKSTITARASPHSWAAVTIRFHCSACRLVFYQVNISLSAVADLSNPFINKGKGTDQILFESAKNAIMHPKFASIIFKNSFIFNKNEYLKSACAFEKTCYFIESPIATCSGRAGDTIFILERIFFFVQILLHVIRFRDLRDSAVSKNILQFTRCWVKDR